MHKAGLRKPEKEHTYMYSLKSGERLSDGGCSLLSAAALPLLG